MTKRRIYQALLLACAVLGVAGALLAVFDLVRFAVAAVALSVVALAGVVHLRALLVSPKVRSVAAAVDTASLASLGTKIEELRRAQAASESFILGDLLAMRQQLKAGERTPQDQPRSGQ